ncbi:DUF4129 domain-containing protein [Halomicroarcula sp. GCM10025709]|uniref:DUF4129 domain-containing protein n=1 Tax=Haloarcula TaxID=2237 RepID=UPI0024C3B8B2|nr:DUF4129 domain-containing protein [Halomicroarcula sp. YJ-61-S]
MRRWLDAAVQAAVGALIALAASLDRSLARLSAALRALIARETTVTELLARLRRWIERAGTAERATAGTASTPGDGADPPAAQVTIREAWRRFLTHVSLPRYWTHSPGDIAAHAVAEDGLPPEAVRTLRDAFRAVEYGDRGADERVAAVQAAIEAIEAAADGEGEA